MASLTPEQRARMLKSAEAKYRAQGLPGWQAKRAAAEAVRTFMDKVNAEEARERAQQRAANS